MAKARAQTEARRFAFPRVGYIRRVVNVRRLYEPMEFDLRELSSGDRAIAPRRPVRPRQTIAAFHQVRSLMVK
jgi:hypothetical protein